MFTYTVDCKRKHGRFKGAREGKGEGGERGVGEAERGGGEGREEGERGGGKGKETKTFKCKLY